MNGRTLRILFHSAGRLLDFSGVYNSRRLAERFSRPGWLRDRQNLMRDGMALQIDVAHAARRLERHFEQNAQ